MEEYLKRNNELHSFIQQTITEAANTKPEDVGAFILQKLEARPDVQSSAKVQQVTESLMENIEENETPTAQPMRRRGRTMYSKKVEEKTVFEKFDKNETELALLLNGLKSSPLTSQYSDIYHIEFAQIMKPFDFQQNEKIIVQGTKGDYFYVLTAGTLDVLVDDNKVNTLKPGAGFGDMALLYNQPRNATILCVSQCKCFGFIGDDFKSLIMHLRTSEVQEIKLFLHTVRMLDKLESQEKYVIAQACKKQLYSASNHIITQGEAGESFFFLCQGQVEILVDGIRVNLLNAPSYFGEAALLHNAPRNATVKAMNDIACAQLDRGTFNNLLGPLTDIMERDRIPSSVSMEQINLAMKPVSDDDQ
ncbi:CAMP-dependent protein kinase regulatory chain [Spironucleus salmonicida]|uniref:cAMP-dependent protein kinase regulatory chain n=1 Tax=Spironucleus salmonicida TaxID=348837 RepID=V6LYX1_9EUKA|nr:CAMP-dependent protein kinase regulatory chain [Spironucleus salmonicida]|eukprot:EST49473.1 cAMP-dependent protein kinase regulatory chain [Spironucleus salmonicida]